MDSHTIIDTVKVEKANAIARYRRFRKLAKLLQFLEVLVALTLLSWSSTRLPAVIKFSSQYLLHVSLDDLSPHVVFLIGNAIVIALFLLSRHIEAENTDGTADFADDYVEKSVNQNSISVESQPSPPLVAEEVIGDEEKQLVCKENADSHQTENEAAATATASIEKAAKQIRKFERTKSERLKRNISVKPRKELRRSETEVRRIVVTAGDGGTNGRSSGYETVENLSNEEFRLTVEAFIEKQQKFLRQQKMAEIAY